MNSRPYWKQRGVGIIEVMVSIAVGLFILAGVLQLYATSTQNAAVVNGSSVIQENARYIFTRIERDVAQAGYAGCNSYTSGGAIVSLVDQTFANSIEFDEANFISGKDDEDKGGRLFDSFIVRYASRASSAKVLAADESARSFTVENASLFDKDDLVFVSNCSQTGAFRVTNEPATSSGVVEYQASANYNSTDNFHGLGFVGENDNADPGQPLAYLYGKAGTVKYYIDTSQTGQSLAGACSKESPEFCALFRETNGQPRELIEGVESFEVEYGYRNQNGELTLASAADLDATEWPAVDRVRISARLNSIERTPINNGDSDRLTREYERTFFLFNQIPGA